MKINNENERQIALENNRLKLELLLGEERDFFEKKQELKSEQAEIEAEFQNELDLLSEEKRNSLNEADLESLRNQLQTKEQIRSEATKAEIEANRKERKTFADDEEKFGKTIAKFKKFQRSEELSNAKTAASELSRLQQSENSTSRAIGKAAALVQIGIDTQRGAIAAYSSLAGIPIAGPALGIVAAAALSAFGLERARGVQSAQTGGVVAGSGFGDTIPFLLEPGELITPRRNFDEVINAVADQRSRDQEDKEAEEALEAITKIEFGFDGPEAADVLTLQQNEARILGTSQEIF